jgi:hypothetical protein
MQLSFHFVITVYFNLIGYLCRLIAAELAKSLTYFPHFLIIIYSYSRVFLRESALSSTLACHPFICTVVKPATALCILVYNCITSTTVLIFTGTKQYASSTLRKMSAQVVDVSCSGSMSCHATMSSKLRPYCDS